MHDTGIQIGFSTGAFSQHLRAPEALVHLKSIGCAFVELGFVRLERVREGQLEEIKASDLSEFQYVSIHAPKASYGENEEAKFVFEQIMRIHRIRPLDLVVFHPDTVVDFSVFDSVSFPVAFENMDNRKSFGRSVADIEAVLAKNPSFRLVLDVNHVYTNDPTMALAQQLYERLGDKIVHVHVSGYRGPAGLHEPLFETKQDEIITAIADSALPIIIESRLSPHDALREAEYVRTVLTRRV